MGRGERISASAKCLLTATPEHETSHFQDTMDSKQNSAFRNNSMGNRLCSDQPTCLPSNLSRFTSGVLQFALSNACVQAAIISRTDGGCAQGSFSPQLLESPHVQLLKSSAASWTVSPGINHQMPHSIHFLNTAIPCPILGTQSQCVRKGEVSSVIKALENRKCRGKLKRM